MHQAPPQAGRPVASCCHCPRQQRPAADGALCCRTAVTCCLQCCRRCCPCCLGWVIGSRQGCTRCSEHGLCGGCALWQWQQQQGVQCFKLQRSHIHNRRGWLLLLGLLRGARKHLPTKNGCKQHDRCRCCSRVLLTEGLPAGSISLQQCTQQLHAQHRSTSRRLSCSCCGFCITGSNSTSSLLAPLALLAGLQGSGKGCSCCCGAVALQQHAALVGPAAGTRHQALQSIDGR